jgi:glycosyltransferase involved in cell wall biosynthesis
MENHEITIVTIAYNCLDELKKTIENVLGQTHKPDEYIIVDGNSSDGTKEYLSSLALLHPEIIIISEKDNGIGDAMNKGLNLASKEWICFMHAGDTFYDNSSLSNVSLQLNTLGPKQYLYGQTAVVAGDGRIIRVWNPPHFNRKRLRLRNFIPHQSVFFRVKPLKEELKGFNSSIKIAMDYDLWIRADLLGFEGVKSELIICRFLDGGLSSNWWPMLMNEREVRLRNYNKNIFERFFDLCYTLLRFAKNLPKNNW